MATVLYDPPYKSIAKIFMKLIASEPSKS
ncbi:uncharacterized protein G2W53_043665 [Senna tora]|uniref:Uncharacterized protein n=1 Tax=Senna tora TaxID=362788 RepID=A0A834SVZ0_9FABA|nr:uncharacterized protein G2W53_043665 [Senna tora]